MAINLGQVDPKSLLQEYTQIVFAPTAASTIAVVSNVDPSTLTAGTPMTLQSSVNGVKLRHARFVTLSCTDDDVAGGLSVTVQVVGTRWGRRLTDSITVTTVDGSLTSSTGTVMFDQILSVTPRVITLADAGDDVSVGFSGTAVGLKRPITKVTDVVGICNVTSDTQDAPLVPSASTVNVSQSAIIGITLAITDRWEFTFFGLGNDVAGNSGSYA